MVVAGFSSYASWWWRQWVWRWPPKSTFGADAERSEFRAGPHLATTVLLSTVTSHSKPRLLASSSIHTTVKKIKD